jgi:hypothetical protein
MTERKVQPETKRMEVDALTVACLGILAYILGNVLHEGAGHGGACLITGGRPVLITAVNMDCSIDNRLIIAGGCIMNALAAAFFFVLGRRIPRTSPRLKYFVWLAMTLNMLSPAGYMAFSGIGGFGDWAGLIQGFTPQWAWRVGLTIIGAALYMLVTWWSLLELRPLIGSDKRERVVHAMRLTIPAYFAGGTVECIAGAFNPQGWILVALSAAASTFGGSSSLVWAPQWLKGNSIPREPEGEPLPIQRSWPVIIAAVIVAVLFITLLGPGVRLS